MRVSSAHATDAGPPYSLMVVSFTISGCFSQFVYTVIFLMITIGRPGLILS